MKRIFVFVGIGFLLVGLPLAGAWWAGLELGPLLEVPPRTVRMVQAPFSWPVFVGLALVILSVMGPFIWRVGRAGSLSALRAEDGGQRMGMVVGNRFPWWGWASLGAGGMCWALAWSRMEWFVWGQLYTFTPLWICYIGVVNGLTWRRTGGCLMTAQTPFFMALFPVSALFWWFFEFLNRFVQNWWYTAGDEVSALHYVLSASASFATVLPAVLSTEELLRAYSRSYGGLESCWPIRIRRPRAVAWATLLISGVGLFLISAWPQVLFPLLWVAPLLMLMAVRVLFGGNREGAPGSPQDAGDTEQGLQDAGDTEQGLQDAGDTGLGLQDAGGTERAFFFEVAQGDWRRVFRFCLAGLICGFFWELWNAFSLAKWIYEIPYVDRFPLFEMPLLGYAGYLPFGLECAVIGMWMKKGAGR